MRIAMIPEYGGGDGAHAVEASAALAQLGHQVRLYTPQPSEEAPDGVEMVPVPAEPAGEDDLPRFRQEVSQLLAQHWQDGYAPDVAHAYCWLGGLAAVAAGQQCQVPVVQSFRRQVGYAQLLGRAADRVVAQYRDQATQLVRLGVRRSQISVIPSGVDIERFSPNGPPSHRVGERQRVLSVGRALERSGADDLIRAMAVVPEAELVLVGGPPAAQLDTDPVVCRLRELAESHQVADRVRLVGAVAPEELPGWYRSADVVACAPKHVRFGRVPLEAMACGVPVVATAVGGLPDTVVDRVTGALVRPNDPRALGTALRQLLHNPLQRLAYAAAALDRARQRYAWQRTADELAAVYSAAGPPSSVS